MKKLKKVFFGTYIRGFVVSYFLFLMIGATMLKLPLSIQEGESLAWIDAIFVSVSGMSTTGLSTVSIGQVLTPFGQTVLAFILQFGGIGLIMFFATFWLLTGKRISFRERTMIMTDLNQTGRSGIVGFIRNVLIMIISIEVVGFITMTLYLYFTGTFGFGDSMFQSFFLTISMFTNAGFDITPTLVTDAGQVVSSGSLVFYAENQMYFMQILAMTLMILGAIGFWPLSELKQWIQAKLKKEKFTFSLFTKILVSMHLGLWIVSAVMVFVIEYNGFLADKSFIDGVFYSLFMSLTTRNAGFATMNMNSFSDTTQVLFGILMFIGSSPNSAGGGIRTTTFLLTLLAIFAFSRGREQVVINRKAIKADTVYKSIIVVFGAASLILLGLMIMTYTEPFTVKEIFFEIASAFGTTGLSLGITQQLSVVGKLVLIVIMFVGRIGVLALLLMFKGSRSKSSLKYPEIDMIVG